MEVTQAIRKRRAVRKYTDQAVDDATLDGLLRLALRAPSGGGQQAWSLLVARDPEVRSGIAELIIAGGATYFGMMRPQKDATDEEHAAWAREYAEGVMSSYRQVPVFVVGLLVPRGYPEGFPGGYEDDLISLAFAFENLMLAARAEGLGTRADHGVPALREGPPARDPRPARRDRPGDRLARRLPRGVPDRPRARPQAQLPPLEGPGARRPLGRGAGVGR